MPELLLELLSEEIPARMQGKAAEDLQRLVCDGLKAAGLDYTDARAFATPRRLALVVDGLPEKQPDISEERRGPRADAPEQAIKGFRGSLPKGAKIEIRETDKGAFHFAQVEQKGGATHEVLKDVLGGMLNQFPWPKSMRWGTRSIRWVRPLHSILVVFNNRPLEFSLAHMEKARKGVDVIDQMVRTGGITMGHRFLAPKPFTVKNFKDYEAKLRKAKVILDAAERRDIIEREAKKLADKAGLKLRHDPALLDEVAGLVEWPVVLMGTIDHAFMVLPDEVLTTVMRRHQKYFALTDKRGRLAPKFVVVANTETKDRSRAVVAGNERVLSARLSDGKFFWDQDRKQKLESRIQALSGRVFHAKLGSVYDKVLRMEELAAALAPACKANEGDARWAARLAKADLSTEMVTEFPELQGVIGRYYARGDGEPEAVADAIQDHYAPQGPADECPSKPLSIAVSLADKIDTLTGFWSIDEKPTGSKDPFALRRAALGVIRLITENGLRLPLRAAFAQAAANHSGTVDVDDLLAFIAERLKVHLRGAGVPHDHVDAVFALKGEAGGEDDLVRLLARVDALGNFLKSDDGGNLLVAYKRAANIVRIEEKKDGAVYDGDIDISLVSQAEEKSLAEYLGDARSGAAEALAAEDFTAAMAAIAELRRPVDAFFDHVTVNCDDARLRENRLRMLAGIGATLDGVADFSRIEGGER